MAENRKALNDYDISQTSYVFAGLIIFSAVIGVISYFVAQSLNWTIGWLYIGFLGTIVTVAHVCVLFYNPEILARRILPLRGTKGWDFAILATWILLGIVIYLLASYELKGQYLSFYSHGISWLVGATMMIFGWTVFSWSMIVNPYFEQTVRIQTELGHYVVYRGPYAWVRHPGYVGIIAMLLATPLLLQSVWTLIPIAFMMISLLIRTMLEDKTLIAELPGYSDYAERVRYRLILGLW